MSQGISAELWLSPADEIERRAREADVGNPADLAGTKTDPMVQSTAKARELERIIEKALVYAPVCGDCVTVSARGGTVVLRGSVHSDAERDIAERAVRAVPAVAAVENLLTVEPIAPV